MPRISSTKQAAVNKAVTGSISEREAKTLIKNALGKGQKLPTVSDLQALKAKNSKSFSPAAKALFEKEISAAAERSLAPAPPKPKGWSPGRGASTGGRS